MLRDSSCGEKSRVSGSSRVIAALVVGIALGVACASGLVDKVGAQSQYDVPSGNIRDSFVSNASPRVSLDESGVAKFSRPLEVPPLYAFDSPLDETGRQIILVDSETKHICVYWIRRRGANSTIELVATRAFELDLKLESFNVEGLTPTQIREQFESGRP